MTRAPAPATRLTPVAVVVTAAALLGALALGIFVGPSHLPPAGVLRALLDTLPFVHIESGLTPLQHDVLFSIRLPRVALGALVGAMLAGAGAGYQGVFRNPLADPYTLGVGAGAGLGATLVIAYGAASSGWVVDPLPLCAFAGAIVAVAVTYVLGASAAGGRSTASILLAGIAVAAFFTSVQTFLQQRQSESLRGVYSWLLGSLNTAGWHDVLLILPYVVVAAVVLVLYRRSLDVLRVGEDEAAALGLHVRRVRLLVLAAATLGAAAAVSVSGLIGFVGIIVPHTVRLTMGASYRRVVPLSLALGAAFLVAADVVARTVLSPAELPIGVITAFCGAPFFVLVLRRSSVGAAA